MSFSNPLGWLLSLLLPIIVLLHLKKQQLVQKEVSYLGLWDEVIKEVQGIKKKWINKYLLLLLQLLIGLLIVMAFAEPMWTKSFKGEKVTIALDTSLTMMAEENEISRIEAAKKEIKNYIENMEDDVSIDFVILGKKGEKIIEKGDKHEVLNKLPDIQASREELNIYNSETLLSACAKPVIFFTDKNIELGDKCIKIGDDIENVGIVDGSYDYYSDTALFRIKNYGKKDISLIFELKSDYSWKDVQKVDIPANETIDVSWTNIPENSQTLSMFTKKQDMLAIDDQFILPIGDKYKKKILMIGENYFLRKVLESIPYIILKTNDDYENNNNNFDLYIINKNIEKERLPINKKIWYTKPNNTMLEGYVDEYKELKIIDQNFSKDINLREVYLKNFSYLMKNDNLQSVLEADGKIIMAYRIKDEIKEIYSTIDFNKTNLSMKPDYPILVDNIIKWFFKTDENWYELDNEIYIEESNIKTQTSNNVKNTNTFYSNALSRIDLKNGIIVLLLVLMVLELEVYRRGI